jgi:hypothetical protein
MPIPSTEVRSHFGVVRATSPAGLLGGVRRIVSTPFATQDQAASWVSTVARTHRVLGVDIPCEGLVVPSRRLPEITRCCCGSMVVVGRPCPRCRREVSVPGRGL